MALALSIKDLTKIYQDGYAALKGISLNVVQGDFFALLGPNGAGKSTTIGILASLIRKSSGKVFIFDNDIDVDFSTAKSHLGLVPQEFNFNMFEPPIQILVNQAGFYGIDRKEAYQRAEKYLKRLGLWDKRNTASRNLSGGLKRRLMIARSLVHEPRLLILDEPTAGVDIEMRHSMWEFLTALNNDGTTIILTTHNLEEAENLCRNIAIIDQGLIIENTSMKHLLNQLHTETFVLDLREPVSLLPELHDYGMQLVDDLTIEVELPDKCRLNQLFSDLDKHGIDVLSMRNKTNRLEQLFMRLIKEEQTGRDTHGS